MMSRSRMLNRAMICAFTICCTCTVWGEDTPSEFVLFDFDNGFELDSVKASDITLALVGPTSNRRLQLEPGHNIDWPGVTLKPKDGVWDGSRYQHLSFDVTSTGKHHFELGLRIDSPADDDPTRNITLMTRLAPGESRTISGTLYITPLTFSRPFELKGMHAAPGQSTIDPAKITQVTLFLRQPEVDHRFTVDNVRFDTPMAVLDPDAFLPFIDEFGQFIHDDWPGKIHSEEDLIERRESESRELASQQGPDGFNRFGGWKEGPRLKASKFFRVEKHDGRWWLIDPDGYRFWSHGMDAVSARFGGSGTEHRESYFRNLPAKNSELGQFYSRSTWAFGFYENKTPYTMYNHLAANLYRKYGKDFQKDCDDLAHQRLRSWGFNTLASWCDPSVNRQRRTPYVEFVHVEKGPVLAGAQKMWTQFHDVFDPEFRKTVAHGIEKVQYAIGDSWCMGFYVDNELYWGSDLDLALWTLKCPDQQAAKREFLKDLKAKYRTIQALNKAWGTQHEMWQDLAEATETPDVKKAEADLRAFSKKTTETYFRTVKEVLAGAAPGQLYLGCRFIWQNETAVRGACKFCDVVSFNRYSYSVEGLSLPEGEDKPVLIGEFHFGALDRGLFHPTRVPARDQDHRAECYQNFVKSALAHPLLVGTHWFQYTDEPTAGRGDGENYQTGFVDICDTPYPEMIAAAREVGDGMYEYRARHRDINQEPNE